MYYPVCFVCGKCKYTLYFFHLFLTHIEDSETNLIMYVIK